MPIDLDGMAVLIAVSRRPDVFPTISDSINELAQQTIKTKLAAKDLSLDLMREIAAMLDETDLLQVLDSLSPTSIGKLVKKLDSDNPDLKKADALAHRQRVLALATRRAEPTQKPVKPPKTDTPRHPAGSAARRTRVKRTLSSKAMTARYQGKSSDPKA